MILIFALAMIAYVVNGVFGLVNQIDMLTQQDQIISLDYVAYFPEFSNLTVSDQINVVYQMSGLAAYILTWIGSVKLLYQNLRRIGRLKFWCMMIISLIYYNISFPLFVLGYFDPVNNENALLNILIFSFGAIISGIIFGISFLYVARTLKDKFCYQNSVNLDCIWISSFLYYRIRDCCTGRIPAIWLNFSFAYWPIVLPYLFRTLFGRSNCFSRYLSFLDLSRTL